MTAEKTKNKIIKTQTYEMWLEDGIIRIKLLPDAEETLETAKENNASIKKFVKKEKSPLLADLSQIEQASCEAGEYYSRAESKEIVSAIGLITKSSVSRVIGNFFLGLNKPPYPVKLFASEKEAIESLKSFIWDENEKN